MTWDVCNAIWTHTRNPKRSDLQHVSLLLVRKYPFLKDTMGSGTSLGIMAKCISVPLQKYAQDKETAFQCSTEGLIRGTTFEEEKGHIHSRAR